MARSGLGALVPVLLFADAVSLYLAWDWVRDSGRGGGEAFLIVALYVVLAFFAGGWAIKIGGGLSLRGAMQRLQRQESPDAQLLNALLAVIGGILLMVPGLASDAIGLLLILPGTRALPRALLRRTVVMRRGRAPPPGPRGAPPGRPPQPGGPVEVDEYRVE